jgi:hypothetical protein
MDIREGDHVHDVGRPFVLGIVTKVLKTRIHVHFMSGVTTPFKQSYARTTKWLELSGVKMADQTDE